MTGTRAWDTVRARAHGAVAAVALALAATVVVAGCALPADPAPRVVAADQVPFDLSGAAQVDAPMFDAGLELQPVTVYLSAVTDAGERRVVPRQRMIPDPVNLATVVGNLMAGGVTPDERDLGLVNQVPGRELRSVDRAPAGSAADRTTATIEVQPQFFDRFPTTEAQRLAIGQIVLTVTGYRSPSGEPPVEQVRFAVRGRVRPVPTADAANPILPVVRASHYSPLSGTGTGPATRSGT